MWSLIALLGPAAIWGVTLWSGFSEENFVRWGPLQVLLLVGAVLFGGVGVVSLAVGWVQERRSGVRGKAPIRGGPKPSKWVFFANFSMITPSIVAINMVSINGVNRPFLLGGLLYVWLATVPAYFYRRHAQALAQVRAI